MRGVGEHGDYDIAFCSQFSGGGGRLCAQRDHFLYRLRLDVEYRKVESSLQEVLGHRLAHYAKSYKAYLLCIAVHFIVIKCDFVLQLVGAQDIIRAVIGGEHQRLGRAGFLLEGLAAESSVRKAAVHVQREGTATVAHHEDGFAIEHSGAEAVAEPQLVLVQFIPAAIVAFVNIEGVAVERLYCHQFVHAVTVKVNEAELADFVVKEPLCAPLAVLKNHIEYAFRS